MGFDLATFGNLYDCLKVLPKEGQTDTTSGDQDGNIVLAIVSSSKLVRFFGQGIPG